jgi:membrane-bound lytic murein transglycosylase D
VITGNGDKHELLLPILSAQTFRDNLAGYDKPLVSWRTYFAKRGERMQSIASKFGMQLAQLRIVNNLPSQKKIKSSATILVPNGNKTDFTIPKNKVIANTDDTQAAPAVENNEDIGAKQDSANIDINNTEPPAENSTDEIEPVKQVSVTHKVKKGETIHSIAKRYGMTIKQIMTSNSLKNNKVKIGQILMVDTETVSAKSTKNDTKYKLNARNSDKKTDAKKVNGKKSNSKASAKLKASKKSKTSSSSKNKVSAKKAKHHK